MRIQELASKKGFELIVLPNNRYELKLCDWQSLIGSENYIMTQYLKYTKTK